MATWHQLQNQVKRYHVTQWSVWLDPPNQCAAIYLCATKTQAEEMMARLKANGNEYVYIYPPEKR